MHPYLQRSTPHLFGHRGASGECPENTMAAFERAVAQGVAYLETDCHASADGEIVLCHDAELGRTTAANGPICERKWRELEALDAGYQFSPDGGRSFPYRGLGVRLPRLEELLRAFPDHAINLEIKQASPSIVPAVVDVVRRAGARDRVLLAAEDEAIMETIHAAAPGTAIGSSLQDIVGFFRAVAEGSLERFEPRGHALQIPPTFMDDPLVTPESVAAAHRLGLAMHVWTINEPDEMGRLLRLGVDGLMSDFPARLVEVAG